MLHILSLSLALSWVLFSSFLPLPTALRPKLSVAFAYLNTTSDLGWNWRHNQGRIYMHAKLLELYPDLEVQTVYVEEIPYASPPDCPSVFLDWAEQQMDIIVGDSVSHQACMANLAAAYPNIVWFVVSGYQLLPLNNWGIGDARMYQAVYLAGMVAGHATVTGKVGCTFPLQNPITFRDLAAFALGVKRANASATVHVGWTGYWMSPKHEVLITRRLVEDMGCDVVFGRGDSIEGILEAKRRGVLSVGFNADHRLLAGESVLVSPYYNWGVLYLQVAQMVLNGTFASTAPLRLFPGLEVGAVELSEPSFNVKRATMAMVAEAREAIRNGSTDVFCGTIETNGAKSIGAPAHCSSLEELSTMAWEPANVVDNGQYYLPSEACPAGSAALWWADTQSYICSACPGGTHSVVFESQLTQNVTCIPCLDGDYAPPNSSVCLQCVSGYKPSPGKDSCEAEHNDRWVVAVSASVASAAFTLVSGSVAFWFAWKATAKLRALRRQYSNVNVAQECAEAIARLDLDKVAWLRDARNPNKIQQSFLQILNILTEVRPFIPDHLLSTVMKSQESAAGTQEPEERSLVPPAALPPLSAEQAMFGIVPPPQPPPQAEMTMDSEDCEASPGQRQPLVRSGGHPAGPRSGLRSLQSQTLDEWTRKRCVYMSVTFTFSSGGSRGQKSQQVGNMLRDVVTISKEHSATIDHVTADTVALHWGLAYTVSEAPLKATNAAMAITELRDKLPPEWKDLLSLSIIITQGVCSVATISAGQLRFFIVRGTPVTLATDPAVREAAARCKCEILFNPSIQQQVQYRVECMPRCVFDRTLFWQPVQKRTAHIASDEWMYELQNMERPTDKWSSAILQAIFQMLIDGRDASAIQTELYNVKNKHLSDMSPQDVACLDYLLDSLSSSAVSRSP